jgi:hypothetical protein
MILEDCICFGRTVPEDSKKYGRKVCSIFYSPELREFIRVYPLMTNNPVRMRYRCNLDLIRNTSDSRKESWKLRDPETSITNVRESPKSLQADKEVFQILKKHEGDSIKSLNQQKKSIGVIRADLVGKIHVNNGVISQHQQELFDDVYQSLGYKADFVPYLKFSDTGGSHEIQVREWGVWEYLRKNQQDALSVFNAMRLHQNPHHFLIVGNMLNFRNNWLVVGWFKTQPIAIQETLFSGIEHFSSETSPMSYAKGTA